MELTNPKMLSVVLDNGGWYVEPLDSHLFLHIARDASGEIFLLAGSAPDANTARLTAGDDEIIATISLYDLLEINRKAAGQVKEAPAGTRPGA